MTYFSLRIQQRPLFIIKPHDTCEVERILNYVKLKNLTVRIMNGRHSTALVYSEVLIDMSGFLRKELIGDKLFIGAGLTQGQANEFLFNQDEKNSYSHFGCFCHPRADTDLFPGGSAATVGVAGLSTVGGVGKLVRTYGLTVDSVLGYRITLPPTDEKCSRTIIASKNKNSSMFWALRGGMASNLELFQILLIKLFKYQKLFNTVLIGNGAKLEKF